MNLRNVQYLILCLIGMLAATGCTRHVCPAYHSSYQLGYRHAEQFFSYARIDSVNQKLLPEKTPFGLLIFHYDSTTTRSAGDEDDGGFGGDVTADASESVDFKSSDFQSKWMHKRKSPEALFQPTKKDKYGMVKKKLGIFPKIFKSRRKHIMKYVPAKLKFPEADTDTTASAEDSLINIQPNVEQLYYSIYIEPYLPKPDTIRPDTASIDTLDRKQWWKIWEWKLFQKNRDSVETDSTEFDAPPTFDETVETVLIEPEKKKKHPLGFLKKIFAPKETSDKTQTDKKNKPPKPPKGNNNKPPKPPKEKKEKPPKPPKDKKEKPPKPPKEKKEKPPKEPKTKDPSEEEDGGG